MSDKVVILRDIKEKSKEDMKLADTDIFSDIIQANKDREEKLKRERNQANKRTLRNYKIKSKS
jgi:hypothetical protein